MREKTDQGGLVYQDNHLAYDALGQLRDVADARVHLSIDYDAAGNRCHIQTHVINGVNTHDVNRQLQAEHRYDGFLDLKHFRIRKGTHDIADARFVDRA